MHRTKSRTFSFLEWCYSMCQISFTMFWKYFKYLMHWKMFFVFIFRVKAIFINSSIKNILFLADKSPHFTLTRFRKFEWNHEKKLRIFLSVIFGLLFTIVPWYFGNAKCLLFSFIFSKYCDKRQILSFGEKAPTVLNKIENLITSYKNFNWLKTRSFLDAW